MALPQASAHATAALLVALVVITYYMVGLQQLEEALISLAVLGCCLAHSRRERAKGGRPGGVVPAWAPDTSKTLAAAGVTDASRRRGLSTSAVSLFHAVRPFLGKEAGGTQQFFPVLIRLLEGKKADEVTDALAGMLEQIGQGVEAQLLDAVRQATRTLGTERSPRLDEIMMKGCLYLDLHAEFEELFEEAREAGTATQRVAVLALHHSCSTSDLKAALGLVPALAPFMAKPTNNLQELVKQLVHMAVKAGWVPTLLAKFSRHGLLNPLSVGALLWECSQHRDFANVKKVGKLARFRGIELSGMAFGGLIRASDNAIEALQLFKEALGKQRMGGEVIVATAQVAISQKDEELARAVLHNFHESAGLEAAASIMLLLFKGPDLGVNRDEAILQAYDTNMQNIDPLGIPKIRTLLVNAAVTCNRSDLLERLVQRTDRYNQFKVLRYLTCKLQSGAISISLLTAAFKACPQRSPSHYTIFVKGLLLCRDFSLAKKVMDEAITDGMANDTTFYTVIDTLLDSNDLSRARATIESIIPESLRKAMGASNFHMDAYTNLVTKLVSLEDYRGAWMLFAKMDSCGLTPDRTVCTEMMKAVTKETRAEFEGCTSSLVTRCWSELNETMVCEVARAWMRCGNVRGLMDLMNSQRSGPKKVQLISVWSCVTLMKAWAFLRDSAGIKGVWNEACTLVEVPPADVQAAAVEGLVRCGDADGSLWLIRHLLAGKKTQVEADLYSYVIGGLSQQMRFQCVWALHDELVAAGVELTKRICLALLMACENAREMHRAVALLEYMELRGISRDTCDYHTVIKGYCRESQLDKAFGVLKQMKESRNCRPDSATYNTLIDACATRDLHDSGMNLLEEMEEAGVPVTTATLVSVMKLAGPSNLDKAEWLGESLSRKHGISLDASVYNRLILVSTATKQWERSFQILQRMMETRVKPDSNTYARLIMACLQAGRVRDAVGMIRSVMGLPGGHPCLASFNRGLCRPSDKPKARMLVDWLDAVADSEEAEAVHLLQEMMSIPGIVHPHRLFRHAALAQIVKGTC